jgi:uncharacterized protein (TIGR03066 family)
MTLTTACLCVMFVAAAPVPKEKADADKVVGKWKLVKSSNAPDGLNTVLILELNQNGKMTIHQTSDGRTVVYEGEYKVIKGELPYTMKLPGGREKKETLTIKKLTETELQVVDPDGIQEDFERVKPMEQTSKPEEKK